MKSIRLKIEDLDVVSFIPDERAGGRGTVFAHSDLQEVAVATAVEKTKELGVDTCDLDCQTFCMCPSVQICQTIELGVNTCDLDCQTFCMCPSVQICPGGGVIIA